MKRSLGFLGVSALGVAGFVVASTGACASTSPDREQAVIGPENPPRATAEGPSPPGGPSGSAAYPSGSGSARAMKRDEASTEARIAFDLAVKRYTSGQGPLVDAIVWSERARDLRQTNAYTEHRDRMVQLEQVVIAQAGAGGPSSLDVHTIAYFRALAESNAN